VIQEEQLWIGKQFFAAALLSTPNAMRTPGHEVFVLWYRGTEAHGGCGHASSWAKPRPSV